MKPQKLRYFLLFIFFIVLAFIWIAEMPAANLQEITIRPYKTISYNPPKKTIPRDEDKSGYVDQKDYGGVIAFDFNLETSILAAVTDKYGEPARLLIIDLRSGNVKYKTEIPGTKDFSIRNLKISPDGNRIAIPITNENVISLWDIGSGTLIDKKKTSGSANDIDWHPDGESMAVASGNSIEIWKTQPLSRINSIRGGRSPNETAMCVKWSPEGEYFAIGTTGPSVYISTKKSQSPTLLPKLKGTVQRLKWNSDGTYLAASDKGSIYVWSNPKSAVGIQKNYSLVKAFESTRNVNWEKMTWDPSGKHIAFGDNKSNFFIWKVSPLLLVKKFTPHANSNTIEAHWKKNILITVGGHPEKTFKLWRILTR